MATTAIQAAERNIVSVALADIQPSSYNPRKNFDETSLAELADSIRQQGVLQAIGVRPIADNRFEVVFGERRYRAAQIAGLEKIPAVILEVSEEEAEEMAVTENLQRKDVTPIEEANAYQKLIESGRHDIQSLAVQFGKNEKYIRTRLKFVSLIPEIAVLLEQDEITISVATEICRYGEDIQKEVYEKHLKNDDYNSWRGMKAADVAESIERQYTTDLDRYSFDKTLCLSCPHNTKNMMLFCEGGCGNCANRTCLVDMNTAYLIEKAVQLVEQHPAVPFGHQEYYYNKAVVERLTAMGYEVERIGVWATAYPEAPEAPEKEDYETEEELAEANKDYEQELGEYIEECEEIRTLSEAGEISLYLRIEDNDIALCYVKNTATTANATNGTAQTQELSPIEKLEKQDKRNKEIALEKTVEDTKKRIFEVDMTETKFGKDEDKMIYFFLLSSLRRENFGAFGIEEKEPYHYLTDTEKLEIIENLTAVQKAIIRRDYLLANFKNAQGNNATATLLLGFAEKHMAEQLADIKNGHNEVYEKRHQRLEERKAVLLVKAQQEAEQSAEAQPEAEVQVEELPQDEDMAA